jgi:co-chaperonin GroES (HSP10)
MLHEEDPRDKLLRELGDVSNLTLLHNQVLAVVYQRPEKTKSGFILTSQTLGEDKFQGKVCLIVKKGPQAFVDTAEWQFGDIKEGDWVIFRPSDGWSITVNGVLCRWFNDTSVKGVVADPDLVW